MRFRVLLVCLVMSCSGEKATSVAPPETAADASSVPAAAFAPAVNASTPAIEHAARPPIDAPLAAIKDWPIAWPPERDAAMLAYRRTHENPTSPTR